MTKLWLREGKWLVQSHSLVHGRAKPDSEACPFSEGRQHLTQAPRSPHYQQGVHTPATFFCKAVFSACSLSSSPSTRLPAWAAPSLAAPAFSCWFSRSSCSIWLQSWAGDKWGGRKAKTQNSIYWNIHSTWSMYFTIHLVPITPLWCRGTDVKQPQIHTAVKWKSNRRFENTENNFPPAHAQPHSHNSRPQAPLQVAGPRCQHHGWPHCQPSSVEQSASGSQGTRDSFHSISRVSIAHSSLSLALGELMEKNTMQIKLCSSKTSLFK